MHLIVETVCLIGPEEFSTSYPGVKQFEDPVRNKIEENVFETSGDITEDIYEDNRENSIPTADIEATGETGPLTCLVCR